MKSSNQVVVIHPVTMATALNIDVVLQVPSCCQNSGSSDNYSRAANEFLLWLMMLTTMMTKDDLHHRGEGQLLLLQNQNQNQSAQLSRSGQGQMSRSSYLPPNAASFGTCCPAGATIAPALGTGQDWEDNPSPLDRTNLTRPPALVFTHWKRKS